MVANAQYANRRRSRTEQMVELLALQAIGGLVALGVGAVALYYLVQRTSATVALAVVAVLAGLGVGVGLLVLLWAKVHWRGAHWVELASLGRGGATRMITASDGTQLHVEIEGSDDAPLTLVFCHGAGVTVSAWHHQRAILQGTRFRRVYYDMRGHGRSGRGRLDEEIPGVRQLGDDLARVIDEVAPAGPLVLLGHSLGGMSVLALPGIRPDVMGRVRGLVLCSTTAGPLRETATVGLPRWLFVIRWLVRREAAAAMMLVGLLPRWTWRIYGLAPYLLGMRVLAVHRANSKQAVRHAAAMVYETGFKELGDLASAAFEHDERWALPGLADAHVSVLGGRNDRLIPPTDHQAIAAAIPGARFTQLGRCGHMLPTEYPGVFNDEMRLVVDAVLAEVRSAPGT